MRLILVLLTLFISSTFAAAQNPTNASITAAIKSLGADGSITLEHDTSSGVTTIRAVSENFDNAETKRVGAKAMNFAVGTMYAGTELRGGETYKFSFWVLSGKPVFAGIDSVIFEGAEVPLTIGGVRHVRRERDAMEYVNIELSRERLSAIASASAVTIGRHRLTLTPEQKKLLANLLQATR